jgi:cytidylate kinase
MRQGWSLSDEENVGSVARRLAAPGGISLRVGSDQTRVFALGEEVSEAIRAQEVGLGASLVSQLPVVREALLAMQRELGRSGGVVLEGRDIGSVVFPDAEAKFFLTASTRVRAERRRKELFDKGETVLLEDVEREVIERDRRDSMRAIAPLIQADDAVVVDSSGLSLDEVVAVIVEHVRQVESQLGARAPKA